MSSLEENTTHQLNSFPDQRFLSAAQEILEQERSLTLDREDQGTGLDFPTTISAAPQVCNTLLDQSVSRPAAQGAHLSPNKELRTSGDSAQDEFLDKTKQEQETVFLHKQDFVDHYEDVKDSEPERDGLQAYSASFSDDNKAQLKNLKDNVSEPNSSLIVHGRSHTGVRPYQCDVCKKSFTRNSHHKTHKRIHTGEKPYICDTCRYAFSDSSAFIRHKYIHTGEKRFCCNVCKTSFRTSTHLKTHKHTHTGERPYSCDVCGKAFMHNISLKHHKCALKEEVMYCGKAPAEDTTQGSNQGTEEREAEFSCGFCGRRFFCESSLSSHLKNLQGVSPLICDVCGQVFCQDPLLLYHQRTHC